jgi:hypothetical protein
MSLLLTKRGRRNTLKTTLRSGMSIGGLWMPLLKNPQAQKLINKGSLDECSLFTTSTINSKHGWHISRSSCWWFLVAHIGWFNHVGYKKGLSPTSYYNDIHEQVGYSIWPLWTWNFHCLITFNLICFYLSISKGESMLYYTKKIVFIGKKTKQIVIIISNTW